LSNVLETLLGGLADDSQDVRETALRAAQEITRRFGASYTALLLPPLEEGVFDPDWRIRHASVQLMGQLIEQILRANRIPIHNAELMSCEALPKEWRAHMLASLYIVRSDEHMQVRNSCSTVWKAVVQNTPRTLKELLPALMKRLIANLASTNREKQRVAARCVGDLISKLGERVMPELMPIFMSTLSTGDAHVREGVCIGLAELINATTKQMLADYLTDLIPAIRQAIIDDVDTVRNSASVVVALLQDKAGARATTDVVTWVLAQLSDPDVEDHGHLFLNGLEQLISKQPGAVLPIVLKNLTEEPEHGWTVLQIQGLAVVAAVPDTHTVHQKLSDVLPVFIRVAGDTDSSEEMQKAALESAGKVMDRVEQGGLEMLVAELSTAFEDSSDSRRRAAGMSLLEKFFQTTQLDVVPILPMVLPAVLPAALADEDEGVLAAGVRTLNGILKKCTKETLAPFQQTVREIVLQLVTNPETKKEDPSILLPGLSKHSGIEPLFPIYQQGLMYGNAEGRELAAKGLGELVNHTTMEGLKPYVVKITGPLIRIVGDRFPSTVKIAIVDTLKAILVNGGPTLKPFLPQLQTTYVKLLEDPSETVRQKAGDSLGMLVRIAARTDALIKDLLQGIEGKPDPNTGIVKKPDPAAAVSMFIALGIVLMRVPAAVTEEQRERLQGFLLPRVLGTHHEPPADAGRSAGVALAMLLRRHLPTEASVEVLQGDIAAGLPDSSAGTPGPAWTLAAACRRDDQDGQLKDMHAELSSVLKKLVQEHGSKLASNADAVVKEAASELKKTASQL
jgi:HEAT repeat protein